MKLFKPTYTEKGGDGKQAGKKKECKHWYLTFTDNRQVRRKLPLFTSKRASDKAAEKVQELLECAGGGVELSPDLVKWLETIPVKIREKLKAFGLIDNIRISNHIGKTLAEHIEDFHKSLLARDKSEPYAAQTKTAVEFMFKRCEFTQWNHIDAGRILSELAELRKDTATRKNGKKVVKKGISQRTSNDYLRAVKQFCRWMIKDRRARVNPVEDMEKIDETEFRRQRRALTLDEQKRLLQATENAGTHHNMTGFERALVYRLALQTGLRANEIRTLTVSAFDFTARTVTVLAAYSKDRKTATLHLKADTAAMLKQYLSGKLPGVSAFNLADQPAKMLKKDLAAAGIEYRSEQGQADFHSLRHTFGSMLAASGVHPKTAQTLMRHKDINLTMSIYTHSYREAEVSAIDSLPDLAARTEQKNLPSA